MKREIFSAILLLLVLFLPTFNVVSASTPSYSYVYMVTYGRGVVEDTTNQVLSFTVAEMGNGTLILQQAEDGSYQYTMKLHANDFVLIDYKNCSLTCKSITEFGTYSLIGFVGEANSVTINAIEIPEFSSFLIPTLFMIITLVAIIVFRRKMHTRRKQI